MLSLVAINDFLQLHKDFEQDKILSSVRQTRATTRRTQKILFNKIEHYDNQKIIFYDVEEREHQIKMVSDGDLENIAEVTCNRCDDVFCSHRQLLLTKLKEIELETETEVKKELSKKRKKSPESGKNSKRQRIDAENDPKTINTNTTHEKIKLVRSKKTIELSEDLLAKVQPLKMSNIMNSFGRAGSYKDFYDHCVKVMNENNDSVHFANELTVEQADTSIWHELRIGRVTASRLYETTRCTMAKGSLVDKFLGKKSGWSFAMMRGTLLEEYVFEEVKKEFPSLSRSGLIMNQNIHPFFAASPDGIHEDFVLEIKCPNTQKTFETYIDVTKLSKKYFAQIQLQMLISGKKKALLAVASLDFESTRSFTKIWIPLDSNYLCEMIEQAEEFYEKAIFPALKRKFAR